jgi:hypothetical protein
MLSQATDTYSQRSVWVARWLVPLTDRHGSAVVGRLASEAMSVGVWYMGKEWKKFRQWKRTAQKMEEEWRLDYKRAVNESKRSNISDFEVRRVVALSSLVSQSCM